MSIITFEEVDRSIVTLNAELAQENTLLPPGLNGAVQRVLKIYRGVKPVLVMIQAIVPPSWRKAIGSFTAALDVLALTDAGVSFKAGKDV
jgi:hypothetical protein